MAPTRLKVAREKNDESSDGGGVLLSFAHPGLALIGGLSFLGQGMLWVCRYAARAGSRSQSRGCCSAAGLFSASPRPINDWSQTTPDGSPQDGIRDALTVTRPLSFQCVSAPFFSFCIALFLAVPRSLSPALTVHVSLPLSLPLLSPPPCPPPPPPSVTKEESRAIPGRWALAQCKG